MNKTNIEYLDYTWNPIAMRCTPVSDGCRNCWHLTMAKRLAKNPLICLDRRLAYGNGAPQLIHKELQAPLHLRKPARIGVQFMGDLFHENIDSYWHVEIMQIIRKCPQHIFLFLTKRPSIMKDILFHWFLPNLSNLWLGVSISNQPDADKNIPILLQMPAAHYFISHEPGLGIITYPKEFLALGRDGLLITGGETGPKARPMHPDIPRHDRDQCQVAGVSFFFKNWGEWTDLTPDKVYLQYKFDDGLLMHRVGKKNAGHLLDGKEHREFPK